MKRSIGCKRPVHWSRYTPSSSKISTRWFARSATRTRPRRSTRRLCGNANCPGPAPRAPQRLQHLAVGCADADGMVPAIRGKHPVVAVDPQAVRRGEQFLAPGAEEVSMTVEHQHGRMGQTVERVYLVLRVDRYGGNETQLRTLRTASPIFDNLILKPTRTHRHGCISSPHSAAPWYATCSTSSGHSS